MSKKSRVAISDAASHLTFCSQCCWVEGSKTYHDVSSLYLCCSGAVEHSYDLYRYIEDHVDDCGDGDDHVLKTLYDGTTHPLFVAMMATVAHLHY